ncbi:hypothetical protein LR69_00203 [Geobacillus sp. BCO2]|nr:hypothetical protein LR69_00203 [Geobacillus sp. BCO2]
MVLMAYWLVLLCSFILASFFNVVGLRVPAGESIISHGRIVRRADARCRRGS